MASPQWNGSPSRYEPNPIDDRALTEVRDQSAYLAIATAIEQIELIHEENHYRYLARSVQTALNTAEAALRRAAFGVVVYAPVKETE